MNSLTADEVIVTIVVISIVAVLALVIYEIIYGNRKRQEKFTKVYNIKHKTNFKTHSDLMNYIRSSKEKERAKKHKEEMQRIAKKNKERQKEERTTTTEPSSSDIGARLKKLRQMYKDGILSKVEFEKAKNKLLK